MTDRKKLAIIFYLQGKTRLLVKIVKISLEVNIYHGAMFKNSRLLPVNYRSEEESMTTLKCLQEHKHNTELPPPVNPEKRSINEEDDLINLFPLPRYFQVHFEHIHDNTHDVQGKLNHLNHNMQSQLDQLKLTLAKVEDKLDRYMALLGHHIEPGH